MLSIHFTKEKLKTRGTNTYCLGAHNVVEKMTWKLLLALCITLLVSLFYLLILSFCHRVSCSPGWLWAPNLLLHLPRAGIAHMYHYAWLTMFLKSMPSFGHPFWKNKKQYFFVQKQHRDTARSSDWTPRSTSIYKEKCLYAHYRSIWVQVWSLKITTEQGIHNCWICICAVPSAPGQCCKMSCANPRWGWNRSGYLYLPLTIPMSCRVLTMADDTYSRAPVFCQALGLLIPLTS